MKTREHIELVVLTHNSLPFSPCCISRFFFKSISSLTCTPSFLISVAPSPPPPPLPLFLFKMEPSKAQGKRILNFKIEEEEEAEEDQDEDHASRSSVVVHGEDDRRKRVMLMNSTTTSATTPSKKGSGAGGSTTPGPCCQAQSCNTDLSNAKQYNRRHKVCDFHAKAPAVVVGGMQQRFCQQCSRFHNLSEFDDNKRSCRRRLAGHNERRRKSSSDYPN